MTEVLSPGELEERWREFHRNIARLLARSGRVGESTVTLHDPVEIDERLVQVIWADQLLRKSDMVTSSGKSLEVIEPGRWNTSRGPDFLDARIRLAGEIIQGDVEIHLDSADWTRHGHHQDFEYNRVVLHAALKAHDDRPYEEQQNGQRLERVVLESLLEPDLDTIRATVNPSDYPYGRPDGLGICHEELIRLPREQLHEFFQLSGRSRIEEKISRFEAQRRTAPLGQLVYQALMTSQGFKSSKTLYFLLSKRVPLEELEELAGDIPPKERIDFRLSVLLHVAGILPVAQRDFLDSADEETVKFAGSLDRHWALARPYFSDRLLPPTKRWFAGMRPAGFPTRRLAAVSKLLEKLTDRESPLFATIREHVLLANPGGLKPRELKAFWREMVGLLTIEPTGHYFETHYSLGGKKQRPQSLLGEPAARSLLFNVFLPLVVLDAREREDEKLERAAWRLLCQFPSLEGNSVTRFMSRRLFGDTGLDKQFASREIHQQALFKIFSDCCAENERTCEQCTFLALGEQLVS
ncbi:MAG: DUF2851 family protein [Candidatus Sumerlaeia bacterium]|nr:DUF2851 family protein [Candidatus Sumerlaeia bacterium]